MRLASPGLTPPGVRIALGCEPLQRKASRSMPRLATLLLSLMISCLIVPAVQAEPPVSVVDLVHRSRNKVAERDLDAAL